MESQKENASHKKPARSFSLPQIQADSGIKSRHHKHLKQRIQKRARLVSGLSRSGQCPSKHSRHTQKGRVQDRVMSGHISIHKGSKLPAAVIGKNPRPGCQKHRNPEQKQDTKAEQIEFPAGKAGYPCGKIFPQLCRPAAILSPCQRPFLCAASLRQRPQAKACADSEKRSQAQNRGKNIWLPDGICIVQRKAKACHCRKEKSSGKRDHSQSSVHFSREETDAQIQEGCESCHTEDAVGQHGALRAGLIQQIKTAYRQKGRKPCYDISCPGTSFCHALSCFSIVSALLFSGFFVYRFFCPALSCRFCLSLFNRVV